MEVVSIAADWSGIRVVIFYRELGPCRPLEEYKLFLVARLRAVGHGAIQFVWFSLAPVTLTALLTHRVFHGETLRDSKQVKLAVLARYAPMVVGVAAEALSSVTLRHAALLPPLIGCDASRECTRRCASSTTFLTAGGSTVVGAVTPSNLSPSEAALRRLVAGVFHEWESLGPPAAWRRGGHPLWAALADWWLLSARLLDTASLLALVHGVCQPITAAAATGSDTGLAAPGRDAPSALLTSLEALASKSSPAAVVKHALLFALSPWHAGRTRSFLQVMLRIAETTSEPHTGSGGDRPPVVSCPFSCTGYRWHTSASREPPALAVWSAVASALDWLLRVTRQAGQAGGLSQEPLARVIGRCIAAAKAYASGVYTRQVRSDADETVTTATPALSSGDVSRTDALSRKAPPPALAQSSTATPFQLALSQVKATTLREGGVLSDTLPTHLVESVEWHAMARSRDALYASAASLAGSDLPLTDKEGETQKDRLVMETRRSTLCENLLAAQNASGLFWVRGVPLLTRAMSLALKLTGDHRADDSRDDDYAVAFVAYDTVCHAQRKVAAEVVLLLCGSLVRDVAASDDFRVTASEANHIVDCLGKLRNTFLVNFATELRHETLTCLLQAMLIVDVRIATTLLPPEGRDDGNKDKAGGGGAAMSPACRLSRDVLRCRAVTPTAALAACVSAAIRGRSAEHLYATELILRSHLREPPPASATASRAALPEPTLLDDLEACVLASEAGLMIDTEPVSMLGDIVTRPLT